MKFFTAIAIALVSISLLAKGWMAITELLHQRLLITRPEMTDAQAARYADLVILALVEILLIIFIQSI